MALRLLRVVYAIEFLMALIAIFEVWREVGGQGHLDLMPWYWKFFVSTGLAAAIVKVTATGHRRILWAGVVLLFVICAGLVTYYYHLNEPLDVDEETQMTAAGQVFFETKPDFSVTSI